MADSFRNELIPGYHFTVKIIQKIGGGIKDAAFNRNNDNSFSEVSGIEVSMTPTEYQEGGMNNYFYKLPETPKYSNLKLKRGVMSSDSSLNLWCEQTLQQSWEQLTTHHIVVSMLSSTLEPLKTWAFMNAYPIAWRVSGINAKNNEVAVEEIEFAYLRFEIMEA